VSALPGARSGLSFFDRTDDSSLDDPAVPSPAARPAGGRWRRRSTRWIAVGVLAVATLGAIPLTSASADPSPGDWYRLRMCESSNRYSINTGNGYYGAYQFDLSTWRSVGGTGYPNQASAAEQDARALMLYRMRGWQPWTCARILGLVNDASARSGVTSDITVAGSGAQLAAIAPTASTAPPWPGTRTYQQGDKNSIIAAWQVQMAKRGAPLAPGTGQFGPLTVAAAKKLQAENGLTPTGTIGPNTWRLAWTGRF
jgi:resuscitation-promoting factor RpfA